MCAFSNLGGATDRFMYILLVVYSSVVENYEDNLSLSREQWKSQIDTRMSPLNTTHPQPQPKRIRRNFNIFANIDSTDTLFSNQFFN